MIIVSLSQKIGMVNVDGYVRIESKKARERELSKLVGKEKENKNKKKTKK